MLLHISKRNTDFNADVLEYFELCECTCLPCKLSGGSFYIILANNTLAHSVTRTYKQHQKPRRCPKKLLELLINYLVFHILGTNLKLIALALSRKLGRLLSAWI